MTEDKIHQNRPGRKALFAGAQIPRETSKAMPGDLSFEFISQSTKVLDDFISGNNQARIDLEIADDDTKNFASAINKVLEITESVGDSKEKDRLIDVLENELSILKEKIEKTDNIQLNEELNLLKSEIVSLNTIREDLNNRLNETEKEYKQYKETLEEKIVEPADLSTADIREELESEYKFEKEKILSALKEKEDKLQKIEAEIALERENNKNKNSVLFEIENELKEAKNLLNIKDEEISKLQTVNLKLKETGINKSDDTKSLLKQIDVLKLRLETIVQENPMPVLLTDTSFKVLVSNKAYEKMSGISASDIINMNLRNFEVLEKKGDGLTTVLEKRKRSFSELKIKLPSGVHYLKQYGIPIKNQDGEIKNILIVYNDITKEKEEAENINAKIKEIDSLSRRSETIVQQNPMPIILLNKNLSILVINKAFEEMSGINKSKLLEMNLSDFKINYTKGDSLNVIFSSKKRSFSEITIELPSGTHILEQYAIPILNEKEDISNILIVYNEITALRIREREIEELMKKAKDESLCLEESAKAITANMVALAKGDLVTKSKILEDDKLKVLKEKFNESILSFRILIEEINEKTNLIEGTSEELRRNNEDIAHATEKLAQNACESSDFTRNLTEHFEKISNGISDLSASIEEISSTSQEVMKKTQLATSEGKSAANIGKDASLKMEAVGEISKKSVEEINSLNDEMYKINDIVNLISRIAEQTNMLALNAAIEAARAGEHGRGFSVVAGEVKNLAGESKKAALEIQNMISRIQKNSEKTADSMRHVDEEMRIGINSTNSAISALNKIVEDIETASNGMTEISKATEIQANETNSFMQSIEIANEMTRENIKRIESIAALAEEISATTQEVGGISHEMHDMSVGLKKTMGKFNL